MTTVSASVTTSDATPMKPNLSIHHADPTPRLKTMCWPPLEQSAVDEKGDRSSFSNEFPVTFLAVLALFYRRKP
jgi:hypothetical protein